MTWFTLAIIAYTLLALVNVIDKALLSHFIKDSRVYAFLVGAFGLLAIVLAPFGFKVLPWPLLGLALIAGVWMLLALHWFFRALSIGEVSRVIPVIGGGVPIFTTILAAVVLGDRFNAWQLAAIFLLTAGGVVLVYIPKEHHWWSDLVYRFHHRKRYHHLTLAVGSAFAFALSFVLSKFLFDHSSFVAGFIWVRVGTFLAALAFLTIPKVRTHIHETFTHFMSIRGAAFTGNQLLGALAIVLQSYAISLGNVAFVQAMQGIQFAAVFLLALVATIFVPKLMREYLTHRVVLEKSAALLLIIAGTAILALL